MKEHIEQIHPLAYIGNWGQIEWSKNIFPQLHDKMYGEHHLELMGYLIVNECINKLMDMDKNTKGAHSYYLHAAVQLKDHFNIKT